MQLFLRAINFACNYFCFAVLFASRDLVERLRLLKLKLRLLRLRRKLIGVVWREVYGEKSHDDDTIIFACKNNCNAKVAAKQK